MPHFRAKPDALFQAEMRGERFQIIAEFGAAVELVEVVFERNIRGIFTKTRELRGVLGGGGDELRSLVPPTAAHRMALLEADDIRRRKRVQKVLQRDQSAAA